MIVDRKFKFLAVNPVNGHIYTEEDGLVLCAKDKAVPVALEAYQKECVRLGTNPEHVESISMLIQRVKEYQESIESGIPDTVGGEIARCINGEGL